MRRALVLLLIAGCTKDLSTQPIIVSPAPQKTQPTQAQTNTWRNELCQPESNGATPDASRNLVFSGACSFAHVDTALCKPEEDDYYVLVKRALAGGRVFNFYVNVERFHGAGEYPGLAQVHVTVRDGATLYRWASFQGTVTLVDEGGKTRVRIAGARLPAEPGTPARGDVVVDGVVTCTPSSEPTSAD